MLALADAARLPLPDALFHCIVFSPPYWGLRAYLGDQGRGLFPNLGLESTPEEHIEHMVAVCGELKRVLRDDGVMYMNYGDCYAGSGGGHKDGTGQSGVGAKNWENNKGCMHPRYVDLKQGNLMLMPHRVALALQADGWILRQDLVWSKPNPMPESVNGWRWEREKTKIGRKSVNWKSTPKGWDVGEGSHDEIGQGNYRNNDDRERTVAEYEYGSDYVLRRGSWRNTRSHEYVFMLVKNMKYYCNQEAVREAHKPESIKRAQHGWDGNGQRDYPGQAQLRNRQNALNTCPEGGRNPRDVLQVPEYSTDELWEMFVEAMTNPDDVLHVPTHSYRGAHYATFPPNLIRPLILASYPQRACPECGQAWAPVVGEGL